MNLQRTRPRTSPAEFHKTSGVRRAGLSPRPDAVNVYRRTHRLQRRIRPCRWPLNAMRPWLPTSRLRQEKISIYDTQFKESATIDVSILVTKGQPKWFELHSRRHHWISKSRRENSPRSTSCLSSTVPHGGGLSSSAAPRSLHRDIALKPSPAKNIDPIEKALLCQKAEHEFAGVPCASWINLLP